MFCPEDHNEHSIQTTIKPQSNNPIKSGKDNLTSYLKIIIYIKKQISSRTRFFESKKEASKK